MPKFRKLPIVIEAVQLTWPNWNLICDFVPQPWFIEGCYLDENNQVVSESKKLGLKIKTLESNVFIAKETDWIIKGVKGEFYACDNEIFQKTYEEVKD